jgi:hypothetical protein
LITALTQHPENSDFAANMAVIDAHYDFTPRAFSNGEQDNAVGENSGSGKLLSFGQLQQLTQAQTLILFGQYYRDVIANPQGLDHQNIRQFMHHGWDGVHFSQPALTVKG